MGLLKEKNEISKNGKNEILKNEKPEFSPVFVFSITTFRTAFNFQKKTGKKKREKSRFSEKREIADTLF